MLKDVQTIFIVGIKGVAMANIALILKQMGKHVSGSDTTEEFITDVELQQNAIPIITSFSPAHLPEVDLVIYSAAHQGVDNPQIIEAKKRNYKIMSQSEFLGELIKEFEKTVVICGCHGKTTTSSLLAFALKQLGKEPSYMVGVSDFSNMPGGAFAAHQYFVLEGDEYGVNPPQDRRPKFHFLHPQYAICTNIDYDHPDVYDSIEDTKQAFKVFFENVAKTNTHKIFINGSDQNALEVALTLPASSYTTFGLDSKNDIYITDISYTELQTSFSLVSKDTQIGRFSVSVFGEKNVLNVTGIIAFLLHIGFTPEEIQNALVGFTGPKRRFQQLAFINNIYLFDDYAHHPAEIMATIQAAKNRFPKRRIVIVFQPHTYSRTESLQNEFVQALSLADQVILAPIFASAREKIDGERITSNDLEKIAHANGIESIHAVDQDEILSHLNNYMQKGDVIFTMGAGNIYKIKNGIIDLMNDK